jgi:homoserine kinase type II
VAVLTVLEASELRALVEAYGLALHSARGVAAGSVNTLYAIVDGRGEAWFLRVYEEQSREGALREHALLARIAREGVPTPVPRALADGGGTVGSVHGKPVALFPHVPGEHLCQARVRPVHAAQVGEALARVHGLGERFDEVERATLTGPSRFSEVALLTRLDGVLRGPAPEEVHADARRIHARLLALAEDVDATPELPLVHGDLFRDNVLFDGRGALVGLLDFESASRGSASFDVAVTALAWCFGDELDLGLIDAFFDGYRRSRALRDDELAGLGRALELACLRFATTRITDYELRPPGVGVKKDYRRWLARLRAVDRDAEGLVRLARSRR